MKVALVIVLLLAVILAVSAKERRGKVGCHKFCLARALDNKLDKTGFRTCISKCLADKKGKDDVVDAISTLAEYSQVMSEDIQDTIAELDEDAQREPIEEDNGEEEEQVADQDDQDDDEDQDAEEESDSELSNGQQLQATEGLNVRNKACTDGAKVATVAAGSTLTYTGQTSSGCGYTWYSVKGSFGSGWAASNWLKAVSGGSSGGSSGANYKTRGYPLFKQCDSRWGNNRLGSSSTICKVGCLMSSVSMALNGLGKRVEGQESNPGTLNAFLMKNGGYSGNLFIWGSVARFGLSYIGQPTSKTDIKNYIKQNKVVILNVNQGGHWVLATGFDGDTFHVNDPGFSRSSYTSGEVVRAGVFSC